MNELTGRVAVVTGGSSGIGLAAAAALAELGARVRICGVAQDELDAALLELSGQGHHVEGQVADVTNEAAMTGLMEETVARTGALDILVAAAGIQRYGTAADTTAEQWDEVISVNLTGVFFAVKHALPAMRQQGGGSVVIVSSVQAFVTQTGVAAYTTSKGALNAFARSVAIDEAQHGIRVNTVCPGSVDTPTLRMAARKFSDGSDASESGVIETWGRMHPLGRVARPQEVGQAVAFLASDRASFITGVSVPVDGGLMAAVAVALPE